MKTKYRAFILLIPVVLLALCAKFLENPLNFDDQYFFLPGEPARYFAEGFKPTPRWWVYETLAATFVYLGPNMPWLRLGNLLAHLGTTLALFFFIRRLLIDLDGKRELPMGAETAAFVAAFFFAVHPLAIFTQGYLIQRTIVCASLFSLLTWMSFWRGLNGSRTALWGACLLFVLTVFAKEHAVMVPCVSFLVLTLYLRSGMKLTLPRIEVFAALFAQGLIALYIALQLKGIIGEPYEIMTSEVLEGSSLPIEHLYPLSVLNQTSLFFKYVALWIAPNPAWISIDMREPFPINFSSWKLWFGLVSFVGYILAAGALLLRGGAKGLLGLALLAPCLLFGTEFASTRFQEPFVIYRSYLWMPSLFLALALGIRRLSRNLALALSPIFFLYFLALSFDRLSTFSNGYLVWNEAAILLEKTPHGDGEIFGAYRIYYNRGNFQYQYGMVHEAMADFDKAIASNPKFSHAYYRRGVVYMAQKEWTKALVEFETAISLLPTNVKSYLGRAEALEMTGQLDEARITLRKACELGDDFACKKVIE